MVGNTDFKGRKRQKQDNIPPPLFKAGLQKEKQKKKNKKNL